MALRQILGHFFNWGLLGVLTVQAYIYYLVFPGDALWPTKSLAVFVYILEVAQTCIITSDAFRNFGSGWGDMLKLDLIGTYWLGLPVMTAIISCVVQFVYAWRVWRLIKRWWTPGLIVLVRTLSI
ncbi:hypothetical protein BDZ89DRAFT_960328 [Hymenopellis radicata]|nr:hypothetical protein BDZ89DRAFT_960328 [Hymenopellis radicata]